MSAQETKRVAFLEKQRSKMLGHLEQKKQDILQTTHVKIGMFVSQNDVAENELKKHTVGLVQLEDFQRIKGNLTAQLENDEEEKKKRAALLEAKKLKRKEASKSKLSFDVEDESEVDSEKPTSLLKKSKKNPEVNTSFLPDKERDEAERIERERLAKVWKEEQESIKKEKIIVTFSYWDGSGHRSQVLCTKGDTIAKFLDKCRTVVDQLKGVNVDNMIYVKEDLIIPHHYTFYDFIVNKTRGKSGPLFSFDVHDDVRLVNDATVETEESHAGKVLLRSWYDRNKHIFPANRWEIFDPEKDYGRYTVKGK